MIKEKAEIRGLEKDIDLSIDLDNRSVLEPEEIGNTYNPSQRYLYRVTTYPEEGQIEFRHRYAGTYTVGEWSKDGSQALMKGPQDLTWFYDQEGEITAYMEGSELTAAVNPDIIKLWSKIVDGDWMEDFRDDNEDRNSGLNRLHPKIRERVSRGL